MKNILQEIEIVFPELNTFTQNSPLTNSPLTSTNCLIIDNIGMLSRLYKYAISLMSAAGLRNGIHNILEAAVYGKPVLFGPIIKNFSEAVELIETGGGISY